MSTPTAQTSIATICHPSRSSRRRRAVPVCRRPRSQRGARRPRPPSRHRNLRRADLARADPPPRTATATTTHSDLTTRDAARTGPVVIVGATSIVTTNTITTITATTRPTTKATDEGTTIGLTEAERLPFSGAWPMLSPLSRGPTLMAFRCSTRAQVAADSTC